MAARRAWRHRAEARVVRGCLYQVTPKLPRMARGFAVLSVLREGRSIPIASAAVSAVATAAAAAAAEAAASATAATAFAVAAAEAISTAEAIAAAAPVITAEAGRAALAKRIETAFPETIPLVAPPAATTFIVTHEPN